MVILLDITQYFIYSNSCHNHN